MNKIFLSLSLLLAMELSAPAATIVFDQVIATTGDTTPIDVSVTFDDTPVNSLQVTVMVTDPIILGDLRGLFFNVTGFTPAAVAGGIPIVFPVTDVQTNTTDLGGGATINGLAGAPSDVGVEFGTPGIGGNDISTAVFSINLAGISVANIDGNVAVRLTSVGPLGDRQGSSKILLGPPAVPEPSTYALVASALAALAFRARRKV